ncbi:hypothetical protein DAT35_10295 [Vitiosangium sp. GDMCC 1.1324]|nr:hypothetical protein DAT35_10295 [Vitiosangium sp. GDMCC 1.1324]
MGVANHFGQMVVILKFSTLERPRALVTVAVMLAIASLAEDELHVGAVQTLSLLVVVFVGAPRLPAFECYEKVSALFCGSCAMRRSVAVAPSVTEVADCWVSVTSGA